MNRYRLVVGQESATRPIRLRSRTPLIIGRGRASDVRIEDTAVSGSHAELSLGREGPMLRDLDSRNGTWLNGDRVRGSVRLVAGDRIRIGGTEIRFVADPPPSEPSVRILEEENDVGQVFAEIHTEESVIVDESARAQAFKELETAGRNLAVLHEMGVLLLFAEDEDELCNRLLDLIADVLGGDRACAILRVDDELTTRAARTASGEEPEFTVSRTILDKAMTEGISLLTSDAIADERFQEGQSVVLQGIRSAMCAPLRGRKDILGALYVDTQAEQGLFTRVDLELLTTLGIQGGIAIENLRLTRKNIRAERFAAIGGVIAGLSHDIRNVLTSLSTGAYLMDRFVKEADNPDLQEAWEIMRHGSNTIAELVKDMVSYSKDRTPDRRPTDIGGLVNNVVARFESNLPENVRLTSNVAEGLREISIEPPAIDRVLTNLISNASDALGEEGGEIGIGIDLRGEFVEITVSDTGCGIPKNDRVRIFDLLFSTKGSRGTGFGLAISKKIVEEHGGTIDVESEIEKGSLFRILLPLIREPSPGPTPEPPPDGA